MFLRALHIINKLVKNILKIDNFYKLKSFELKYFCFKTYTNELNIFSMYETDCSISEANVKYLKLSLI